MQATDSAAEGCRVLDGREWWHVRPCALSVFTLTFGADLQDLLRLGCGVLVDDIELSLRVREFESSRLCFVREDCIVRGNQVASCTCITKQGETLRGFS